MIVDRQLRVFFRQLGVPVSFAGVSTYSDDDTDISGIFDGASSIGFGDGGTAGIEMEQPELRLPFNAFDPMPQSGDTLTVDGTDYTTDQPRKEEDGKVFVYQLREVA